MSALVLGITGTSGSGKTTLIAALLRWYRQREYTVNVVKHSHKAITLEPDNKDSARFRRAEAGEVLVASPYRYAIMREIGNAPEPCLHDHLARLSPAHLTLVEGFRQEHLPRIEVYRPSRGELPYFPADDSVVAVATDEPLDIALPCLPLNQPDQIARFILNLLRIDSPTGAFS
ncbi:molybdopterin-guanine dinucleotide biosynthesis protein B [Cupriavidus sp. RAF12]|uniref:molybdopterin-guanine dinucleotide biosynthesis protein B n=1 Tax=Cupriavidus sp. RAF12 TaxID=3233050 RepID=UPI003F912C1E